MNVARQLCDCAYGQGYLFFLVVVGLFALVLLGDGFETLVELEDDIDALFDNEGVGNAWTSC